MKKAKTLIYDGSFNGFLTTVFKAFDEQIQVVDIKKNTVAQRELFSDTDIVFTKVGQAKRVWNGIQNKNNTSIRMIYFAFQSEHKGIEILLYRYIRKLFSPTDMIHLNFSDDTLLRIRQLSKSVGREKQRIEAFVRFQLTQDDVYFANIEPDFDVLPLISKHFRSRYADRQWLIYDVKRKYGLFYDLNSVEIISLDLTYIHSKSIHKSEVLTNKEFKHQDLWNTYFKSTSIKSHINMKLHTQHVLKRHWNHMSEKKEAV